MEVCDDARRDDPARLDRHLMPARLSPKPMSNAKSLSLSRSPMHAI
jgi:hypothetical protein